VATDTLDRLLTTLAVRIHAFAICEIKMGWRLAFDPMDAVTIHYVLAGTGTICTAAGVDVAYGPFSIIVVPARVHQSLGEVEALEVEANAADHCGSVADGLVKFTAGDGSRDTLVVCATISASYGGALGLFDYLRGPVVDDVSQNEAMSRLFNAMLAEIARPEIGTRALTEALMKQCLVLLLRRHLTQLSVGSPFYAALEDHRLARAITGVLEQPSAPHTVGSLASLAGMSRSTFAARFAQVFGQAPIEFVQDVRLRLGAHLLQTTDLPVKAIASSVGYANRSYFTRAFRIAHGLDPRAFRARAARAEEGVQLAASSATKRVADALEAVPTNDE
jgi:AraC-like DNA-binding protein